MNHVPENRKFPRLVVNCEIALRSGDGGASRSAIARNISGNGLLFLVAEQPGVGELLEIVIGPGERSIPELSAVVEVIRVENGRRWERGVDGSTDACYAVGARIKSMK